MIFLSLVNINEYDRINKDEASLSSNRRLKISRIRPEKSRRLSVCAEIALIRAVRGYTGEEVKLPLDIEEEEGGRGKLYFSMESPYHGKLFFSLSHAGDFASAAVSDHDIGLDIEITERKIPKYLDKIFSPSLYSEFCKIEDEEARISFFFEKWTSLESYMKLTGEGIYLNTKTIETGPSGQISSTGSDIRGFIHGCTELLEENGIYGYKCSLCSANAEESFTFLLFPSALTPVSGS